MTGNIDSVAFVAAGAGGGGDGAGGGGATEVVAINSALVDVTSPSFTSEAEDVANVTGVAITFTLRLISDDAATAAVAVVDTATAAVLATWMLLTPKEAATATAVTGGPGGTGGDAACTIPVRISPPLLQPLPLPFPLIFIFTTLPSPTGTVTGGEYSGGLLLTVVLVPMAAPEPLRLVLVR